MEKTDRTARTLLTVAEMSDELRVTRGTTYKWIREGTLPAVRVGGTVRVPAKLLVDRLARSIRTCQEATDDHHAAGWPSDSDREHRANTRASSNAFQGVCADSSRSLICRYLRLSTQIACVCCINTAVGRHQRIVSGENGNVNGIPFALRSGLPSRRTR